jgi:hypothetical protein
MLSRASGQLYGSAYTERLEKGWETELDTPGVIELGYMRDLFTRQKWYNLVPDQTHTVVTAGYDGLAGYVGRLATYRGCRPERFGRLWKLFAYFQRLAHYGSIATNTYATAART